MLVQIARLITCTALAACPVICEAADARFPTFRDVEYGETGSDVILAARAAFGAKLEIGMPIAEAEMTMRRAGARCRTSRPDPAVLVCLSDTSEMRPDDATISDIRWTTRLRYDRLRITDIIMTRDEAGEGPSCVIASSGGTDCPEGRP